MRWNRPPACPPDALTQADKEEILTAVRHTGHEIGFMVLNMGKKIMADLTALNTQVARIGTDVTTATGEIRDQLAALQNVAPDDSAGIAAAVASLSASADKLEAAGATLTTVATPPPSGDTPPDPAPPAS